MLKNFCVFSTAFGLALLILVISIFRVAETHYVLSQSPTKSVISAKSLSINYTLPNPGKILPDSFLWPFKAARDRVWTMLTADHLKKADLYLLLADKRLIDAKLLFEKGNPNLGMSVLSKGEIYLMQAQKEERIAYKSGADTKSFLQKLAMSSLKHREIMDQIIETAPEDARPLISKTENYSKNLYNQARDGILQASAVPPTNPFQAN
jgi:hypothetical protein